MNLTEFLLARITEDEQATVGHLDRYVQRERAECEAKRRIIDEFSTVWQERRPTARRGIYEYVQRYGVRSDPLSEDVLRFLALPYADHPDYDESWRP